MAMQDEDDENKKRRNMRIYVETLYELNKDKPKELKEALTACVQENPHLRRFCSQLINAIGAKQEALAAEAQNNQATVQAKTAEYDNIIQQLSNKTLLSATHKKLATFLSENKPDVKFAVMVPALEEWKFDQGKDEAKNAALTRLSSTYDEKYKNSELREDFENIVAAYKTGDFDEIKELRENMPMDMKHINMLFDIRNAICYEDGTTNSHPRSKLPHNVPMEVVPTAQTSADEPVLHQDPADNTNHLEDVRVRSDNNFDNTLEMYKYELEVLKDRKIVSDEDYNTVLNTFSKVTRLRNVANLTSEQEKSRSQDIVSAEDIAKAYGIVETARENIGETEISDYRKEIVSKIVDILLDDTKNDAEKGAASTLLTPEMTTDAIEFYKAKAQDKNLSDDDRALMEQKYNVVLSHGQRLLEDLHNKRGYFFADITNAADAYDGYMHLIDVCEKEENEAKKKEANNSEGNTENPLYDEARQLMESYIEPYDTLYHIPDGKNPHDTTLYLNDRINAAAALIDKLQFNETTLGSDFLKALQHYKFIANYNEAGQPVYENCIQTNSDGKLEVIEGSRLDTVLRFAANETMMQNLANKDFKFNNENLLEGVKENGFSTLFSFDFAQRVVKEGLQEDPKQFTNPAFVEEFKNKLIAGENMDISPIAFDAALKQQANKVETFSNRITSKLGKENTEYLNSALLGQVAKIDKTSGTKDNRDYIKKKALKRGLWGTVIGGGIAFASSYLMTKYSAGQFMSKALTNASLNPASPTLLGELAIGGGTALIGAGIGAAASAAMYLASKKITALIKKEKYGWKDVKKDLKDPSFLGVVAAGALSGASMGFALSGCPQCATYCGFAALGAGMLTRYYKPYRDMRLHGYSRTKAFAMGVLNAAAVGGAGWLGRHFGMMGHTTQTATADKSLVQSKDGRNALEQNGWNKETNNTGGDGFYKIGTQTIKGGGDEVYGDLAGKEAKRRVLSWLNEAGQAKINAMHDDAINRGMRENDFWVNANKAIVADRDGIAAEYGSSRTYLNTTHTGRNFTTPEVHKTIVTNNHFLMHDHTHYGMTASEVDKAANFLDFASGKVNMGSTEVLNKIHLTTDGAIPNHPTTPHINTGLPHNAQYDSVGDKLVATGMGNSKTTFSSFHDGPEGKIKLDKVIDVFAKYTKGVEPSSGFGTIILGFTNKVKKFTRPGAKADRIINEQTQKELLSAEYQLVNKGNRPDETALRSYTALVKGEYQAEPVETRPATFDDYLVRRAELLNHEVNRFKTTEDKQAVLLDAVARHGNKGGTLKGFMNSVKMAVKNKLTTKASQANVNNNVRT